MSMDYKVFIHGEDVYAIWDGGRLAIDSVADYISPDLPVPTDPDDPWNELMVDGVPLRVYTGELPDNHTVLSVNHYGLVLDDEGRGRKRKGALC